MPDLHEALRAAGIPQTRDPVSPTVHGQCGALVRRMRELDVRTVGLVPAGDDVAVPAVALELGRALADRTEGLVGVVDGDGSWPCAHALASGDARQEGRLAATGWLAKNLAVLTPFPSPAVPSAESSALFRLRGVLDQEGAAFHHLVVDLTGFDHVGEHLAACALLDAVAVVARSGRTTTRDVRRWRRGLPQDRDLGVLLTGL